MINHQTITETLSFLLPETADLSVSDSKLFYKAEFNWLLHSDPERPFKRSKTVVILINESAVSDLLNVGNKREAKVLIDLETYFKNKLHQFNPDHSALQGQVEPVEKWKITSLHFIESATPIKGVTRRLF